MYSLPGPTFFKRAYRLTAYQCVMRERVVALAAEQDQPAARAAPGRATAQPAAGREVIAGTRTALQASSGFRGIFSFG